MRFTLLVTAMLCLTACARHGGPASPGSPAEGTMHSGGGGDPLATEFLDLARLIAKAQAAGRADLGVPNLTLDQKITAIARSLEGQSPLVQFPAGATVQCFGADKLGCVDDRGVIRFARDGWQQASPKRKLEVTTMELVKAVGGTNRYAVADSAARTLEFQKTVGPTGFLDASEFDATDQPLLTEHARRLVNRALALAGQNRRVPQFDLNLVDEFPNFSSTVQYGADADSENVCLRQSWRRAVSVSAMTTLEPARRAAVYVTREVFEDCPGKGKLPLLTDTIFGARDAELTGFYRHEASSPHYETKTITEPKPFAHYDAPRDAERLFKPCEIGALNAALARIAGDKNFDKIVKFDKRASWRTRRYELLSFLGTGRRLATNAKYLISFKVDYDHFSIPYTFLVTTREVDGQCRVGDVTTP